MRLPHPWELYRIERGSGKRREVDRYQTYSDALEAVNRQPDTSGLRIVGPFPEEIAELQRLWHGLRKSDKQKLFHATRHDVFEGIKRAAELGDVQALVRAWPKLRGKDKLAQMSGVYGEVYFTAARCVRQHEAARSAR